MIQHINTDNKNTGNSTRISSLYPQKLSFLRKYIIIAISKKLYSHNMGSDYKPFHNNRPPEGGLYDASKVLIYLGWSSRVPVLCNFRGYVRVFKQFTFSLFNVNIT